MEAQLQEQQSRDKEIKAVNETLQVSLNLKFCVILLGHPGGGRIVKGEVGGVYEHLLLLWQVMMVVVVVLIMKVEEGETRWVFEQLIIFSVYESGAIEPKINIIVEQALIRGMLLLDWAKLEIPLVLKKML